MKTQIPCVLLLSALTAGCASQASLTVLSQPEGAYVVEKDTSTAYGMAPVTVVYDKSALLQNRLADGCYLVKGFEVRWVSGASAQLERIRLCESAVGTYNITFARDPVTPGLDKDLQFALQVQAVRAQAQQAQAAEDAAVAAAYSAWGATQQQSLSCTSTQIGNTVRTSCR